MESFVHSFPRYQTATETRISAEGLQWIARILRLNKIGLCFKISESAIFIICRGFFCVCIFVFIFNMQVWFNFFSSNDRHEMSKRA